MQTKKAHKSQDLSSEFSLPNIDFKILFTATRAKLHTLNTISKFRGSNKAALYPQPEGTYFHVPLLPVASPRGVNRSIWSRMPHRVAICLTVLSLAGLLGDSLIRNGKDLGDSLFGTLSLHCCTTLVLFICFGKLKSHCHSPIYRTQ